MLTLYHLQGSVQNALDDELYRTWSTKRPTGIQGHSKSCSQEPDSKLGIHVSLLLTLLVDLSILITCNWMSPFSILGNPVFD